MLEPEVVMEMAGEMFLNAEEARVPSALGDPAGRFRGFAEVALLAVLLERHRRGNYAVSRLSRFSGRENTRNMKPALIVNAVTAMNRFGIVIDS